jgi:hypothetical protein
MVRVHVLLGAGEWWIEIDVFVRYHGRALLVRYRFLPKM